MKTITQQVDVRAAFQQFVRWFGLLQNFRNQGVLDGEYVDVMAMEKLI